MFVPKGSGGRGRRVLKFKSMRIRFKGALALLLAFSIAVDPALAVTSSNAGGSSKSSGRAVAHVSLEGQGASQTGELLSEFDPKLSGVETPVSDPGAADIPLGLPRTENATQDVGGSPDPNQ